MRLSIATGQEFDTFLGRLDAALPPQPADAFRALSARGAPWHDFAAAIDDASPSGLVTYWREDLTAVMALAGNTGRCVIHVFGNVPVAAAMFGIDPTITVYAPLRLATTEDTAGHAVLTIERPSDQFGSFDHPELTAYGLRVDAKVAALLELVGLPAPTELRPIHPSAISEKKTS